MIVIWIAAIVVFGIVEAVTVGLVSIWFVLGAVAGLLAAVLGAALWVQIVLFFVVSIAALAATRPLVQKMLHRDETPTNADRVLGQTAVSPRPSTIPSPPEQCTPTARRGRPAVPAAGSFRRIRW